MRLRLRAVRTSPTSMGRLTTAESHTMKIHLSMVVFHGRVAAGTAGVRARKGQFPVVRYRRPVERDTDERGTQNSERRAQNGRGIKLLSFA